ncbi:outer membrane lipoprotein carrier protein [Hydromonas duriensis]|uniref:Outer-membrane lipoprotein carrier protein n=2 Tax=Hydromonas duriensis TaxID=1527608 RepID=A0A4R6Y9Y3_9BURK|nr:outer membrane lipoprotein carrier protein [Hydromonas duriensis]
MFKSVLPQLFATTLLVSLSHLAHATPIDDLQQFNSTTSSASGSFTQKVIGKSGSAKKVSSGTFIFARPGKFRWTYTAPYEQVLVSDGKTLSIFDKDLNQVTKRSLGSAIGSSPAAILFGGKDLSANFTLSDGGSADGRAWVTAVPKSKSGNFTKVNIGMRNGLPDAMELYDTLGQVTVLNFSGISKNSGAPASTFNFVAPAGAIQGK